MSGFAIVGPNFDTSDPMKNSNSFRSLSLILMVSRLIIMLQYGTVAWYIRGYKQTFLPMALVIGTLFVAAVAFLGVTFAFSKTSGSNAYIGWYIIMIVEAVITISISSFWRVLSFKHTAIVERFGILTLIILGEGVVHMAKAVSVHSFIMTKHFSSFDARLQKLRKEPLSLRSRLLDWLSAPF